MGGRHERTRTQARRPRSMEEKKEEGAARPAVVPARWRYNRLHSPGSTGAATGHYRPEGANLAVTPRHAEETITGTTGWELPVVPARVNPRWYYRRWYRATTGSPLATLLVSKFLLYVAPCLYQLDYTGSAGPVGTAWIEPLAPLRQLYR